MAFLLDTNAWIIYLKNPASKIRARLQSTAADEVFLCSVVKAELCYGAHKYRKPRLREAVLDELFAVYPSLPFDDRAAVAYGKIRHELEEKGQPIGPNDLLIASIAQVNNLTVVTHNVREFSRIATLPVQDWQI